MNAELGMSYLHFLRASPLERLLLVLWRVPESMSPLVLPTRQRQLAPALLLRSHPLLELRPVPRRML